VIDPVQNQVPRSRPVVAVIGLGAMGGVIAERVLQAGFRTIVLDIRREAMEPYRGRADFADSPKDATDRADIIICCLPTLESYWDIVQGPRGIIGSAHKCIYVHAGTTGAPLVGKIDAALSGVGITVLDAPVTGGVARAKAGDLTVIASGPKVVFDATATVLRAYASKIVYFGASAGAAQTMKLVNNMLNFANLALASEILVTGVKAGLDPNLMLEVINSGSGQNSATLTKFPRHILPGTFDFQGWMSHVIKDSGAFIEQARALGVRTPLSDEVHQTYLHAFDMGDSRRDYDITEVIRHMEKAAGVEVRSK